MPAGFYRVHPPAKEPEPPQPTPFPIRIVPNSSSSSSDDDKQAPNPKTPSESKRSDHFYEAWDKFLAPEPKRAQRISRSAAAISKEKKLVGKSGLSVGENASTSWATAVTECKAKVAAIVEECQRLNEKYRDAIFTLDANPYCLRSLDGQYPKAFEDEDPPPWIKRVEDIFDDPQFFIDGATAQDVHQGNGGDCWFLAALMAVSAKKELIENLCVARNEKVGVYGFVFYRDGEWIYEVIDDKLFLRVGDDDDLEIVRGWSKDKKQGMPIAHDEDKLKIQLQRGSEALYFSHCKSNETWLPLIEKAYAKCHGDYRAIEGGFPSEAIEDLTGGVGVTIESEGIMDKDRFWREQLSQVNEKYLFGGGTSPNASKGFIGSHAYAVLRAWEEGDLKLLKMRNPWGEVEWEGDWSDGSKLWTPDMMKKLEHTFGDDGIFWISYQDFLKHFPSINRVRLFDKQWQVAQQWMSVNVPWTVDYLDTKFQFTITKQCSVAIVLSQPDNRYFRGLEGRFLYSLHFRVYGDPDESKYIVRSMHNSGNDPKSTRSVSAEIEDLRPGTYNVVFKVTAVRVKEAPTAKEAILKYAGEQREKLLHVGRRFDYAKTKGNLREMEEANKKQRARDKRDLKRAAYKKARRLNQQERERARKRKKRAYDAMEDKRTALEKKRWEKATARTIRKKESAEAQTDGGGEHKRESEDIRLTTPAEEGSPKKISNPDGGDTKLFARHQDTAEMLSRILHRLKLRETRADNGDPVSLLEDEYESPVEPPEELGDDDFDWDSDMDGPVDSSDENDDDDDDDEDPSRPDIVPDSKNDIFAEDPWEAICVLGLRVYSLNADAKISVIKGKKNSS